MSNPEEKQQHEPLDLSALLEALQTGEDEDMVMNQVDESIRRGNTYDPVLLRSVFSFSASRDLRETRAELSETKEELSHKYGRYYCTTLDVLDNEWAPFTVNDFTVISRKWDAHSITDPNVTDIYNTTRREALDISTSISASPNRMLVNDLTPVRLCSFPDAANFAEKAHLCPKNGPDKKSYSWMYVAAAALGMSSMSKQDREALCKAVCGSVSSGNNSVTASTGLNRSPFNLLSFLDKEVWFDKNPGVIALPVMDWAEARDWNGGSYEIVVLCNDVVGKASAGAIAERIGLTSTDYTLVQDASPLEMAKSVSLLSQVVKASAYCLESKEGPDGGRGAELWKKYRHEFATCRSLGCLMMTPPPPDNLIGKVPIPILRTGRPEGKIVAKIDLAQITPPSPATAAYPDPLLLAYKSSINWTRRFNFRLMAEAEPSEPPYGPGEDGFIQFDAASDQISKISTYSSQY